MADPRRPRPLRGRPDKRNSILTSRRILDAAYELFYQHGFVRVAVDAIAEKAGVTKRTLYYHFESKDAVLKAVLEEHEEFARTRLATWASDLPQNCEVLVDKVFAMLIDWADQPRWSGAGFTRLAMELADLPGHPARTIAKKHKAAIEVWLGDALIERNVGDARKLARRILLLMEGAITLYLVHGSLDYVEDAADAAKELVAICFSRKP